MNSRLSSAILVGLSAAMFSACNSNDTTYELIEDTTVSNVGLTSFSLGVNNNIVANLDSLFFTIDLANGQIFNADSLPVGTKLGNSVVSITHPTVSKLELIFKDAAGETKTVDYLQASTDSVYFGNGTVTLRVVSTSGNVMREYAVNVNVHKVKPDSLYWDNAPAEVLPSFSFTPTALKTVKFKDEYLTLAGDGTSFAMVHAPSMEEGCSKYDTATLPVNAEVGSFTSTGDALYILADGVLYESADAVSWTATGVEMTHIYGAYLTSVLGVNKKADNTYEHVSYPATATKAVPASCPVGGTSNAILYESEWSSKPMLMFTGGHTADGTVTGATWAFDGTEWAQISVQGLPALENMAIVPYQTMTINNQWISTYYPVLLAMGGKSNTGTIDKTVYLSFDRGVHWTTAPAYMQFASDFKALTGFQIVDETSRLGNVGSRAVTPITSWECPFLYMVGGYNSAGKINQDVWRGALNAFRIKPIQ